jgi:tRNA(Ile)-lysidine synthase
MKLSARVLDTIRRHALLRRGDRVLVALSGGPDSVALLRLLRELECAGELVIAGVAHLNHGLRDAAHQDEQFCCALAGELGLAFRSDRVDVRARAERLGTSLEDAGRRARYEWFDRVAAELGADVVATGHTRDDQAETFLLRLIRGAGPRGLSGIHPRSGRVVRPLLDVGRAELRAYLAQLGQAFCDDESNRDVSVPRNKIRHELLPLLQREFSPQITDVLAREAAIARHDEDRLHQEAIDLADSIVLRKERRCGRDGRHSGHDEPDGPETVQAAETVELDTRALASLHPALAVRVGRLALGILAPDRFVGYEHIERLLELARDPSRGAVSLPGQHAVRRGDTVVLSRQPFQPFANSYRVSLSIPGEVILQTQGWAISATGDTQSGHSTGTLNRDTQPGQSRLSVPGESLRAPAGSLGVAVQAAGLSVPLAVRSRKRGDWFRPFGMGGRGKKLQDFLVDRKVPRERRDSLPLVVDSADRIVWVVGESVAEDFRVTDPSRGVIFLKARRLGGQG